ncbi:MAG: Zn-dependent exopeptidase [Solirubrobacterales bacterium]|nr:Zn-dependent exopeptidase [Solirubrobacterales bacterium]
MLAVATRLAGHGIAALVHVGATPDGLVGHFTATFHPAPAGPPWTGRVLDFPGVSVEARAGGRLLAALVAGPVRVTVRHVAAYAERTTANVVGEIRGDTTPGERVVVGAHYDTQRESPGASDNATGLAALLALARGWSALPFRRTMTFVAFAAEEPAAWGAAHHVTAGDPATMAGMVNFDALGPPVDATRTVIATPGLRDAAVACAARTGWHAEQSIDARNFPYTDNAPFADAGVETCLLWRHPPPHPYYHSAGDVPRWVDPTRLAQDARAGASVALWLATAEGGELPPCR